MFRENKGNLFLKIPKYNLTLIFYTKFLFKLKINAISIPS